MPKNEVATPGSWVNITDDTRNHPVKVHEPSKK